MFQRGMNPSHVPCCDVTSSARLSVLRDHQHADDGQRQAQFVADHLRGRPHGAHQRILRIRCPAAKHDAVNAERCDRENEQQPDAEVRHLEPGPNGITENESSAGTSETIRRGDVEEDVGVGWNDFFFEQEFQAVGDRLKQSERPHAVGPGRIWTRAIIFVPPRSGRPTRTHDPPKIMTILHQHKRNSSW